MATIGMQLVDGLSWPSLYFALLFGSLFLVTYVLIRRYRSRQQLLQRVAELESLSAAGRALVEAELDLEALAELIALQAGQVINTETFQVGLFEGDFYHILFWTINGRVQDTPQTYDLSDQSGLVGWIRDSKSPLLVRDFNKELSTLPASPRYISDTPPRSALFVPLISGEEVKGILAAQHRQPNRFAEQDLRRLTILANQAAAAIANAQLYMKERLRAAQLELVSQIARQVNAVQDLDEIFDQVVRLTQEQFGYHPITIFGIDSQTGEAIIQASSVTEWPVEELTLPAGEGLVGRAVHTGQTIVANNTSEHEHYRDHIGDTAVFLPLNTRSEIAIPLIVNNTNLGVLDVQSPDVGAFTSAEQTALEALAAEVASAIYKAQQLAQQQERAWITTAQFQVADALSRIHNDVDAIIETVTHLTPMLTGVSLCGILLWDEEREIYRGASIEGASPETKEAFVRLRLKLGDWSALDALHVGQETITTERIPRWLRGETPNQLLELLPVAVQTERLGVMVVSAETAVAESHLFQERLERQRNELLQNIVGQLALALENAYLRRAQQEEAWVNTALLQVAEAVNRLIDLNEILNTIVRLVPLLVGVESTLILVWDEERRVFQAGPSYGVSKMGRGLIETLEIEEEELSALTRQGETASPYVTTYTLRLPDWFEKVLGTSLANVFPLNARGRLVGVLMVGVLQQRGKILTTRQLNILNGVAQQAATAVVNNRLYKEAAERDRLAQELKVAYEIQASLIPPGSPQIPGCTTASFWQAARQVSGDFYDFIPLGKDKWGIVVADVADKGVPAALFMAVSRTVLRTVAFSRDDPADVLMRVNDIIDRESQSDLFVTVFYAVWQPATQTLTYANGGHNPPLLIRSNGRTRLLNAHGMALGILPDIHVESQSIRFQTGDVLILYTDGVTEAINEDYDEFGMERMHLAANEARKQEAGHIVRAITHQIRQHAGDTPQFDDITLVVLKRSA